ncbi:hypothetical protein HYPSUDRAFT_914732 [Hypholoma sublateritium FD-334 SS-4]|uniref:Uncharacterized protein n=1 Tax=Hypholoma sublateritium (strain FD-334 SS-4) TaxID=945553 RepID=A0A0D2NIZ8_HYPSF|nr:hypothetical protein HYPSUDRAFT_914732 [Hypholoma sublateritium FD-334 SS-4]
MSSASQGAECDASSTATGFVDLRRRLWAGALRTSQHLRSSPRRTFLITLHDGCEMGARIPHPATAQNFYAVASEVATTRGLRAAALPVRRRTARWRGAFLNGVWSAATCGGASPGDVDVVAVLRQRAQLTWWRFPSRLAGASAMPPTWRGRQGGGVSRSATGAPASGQTTGCVCGVAGGRSSTGTGDRVRRALHFVSLEFWR